MSVFCIWFIAWGNLRGVRESGRMFAVPTYFFIFMMFLMLGIGLFRQFTGSLHPLPIPPDISQATGAVTLFIILKAFASGGAAVTGVEAVSNGVPAFKPVEWKNARTTLMWMGSLLGLMFLGLSFITVKLQVVPTETKTVISQVGRAIFGPGALGYAMFLALQVATTLILILAANTSFADFPAWRTSTPRTTSCRASSPFAAIAWSSRTGSSARRGLHGPGGAVQGRRIQADPFYAIGVFTSFTLSQAGMSKRHLRLREPGWRLGLAINGLGAITTAVVTIVIAVTKFVHGAWAVMVFVPVMVLLLVRMNRQYEREDEELGGALLRLDPNQIQRPIVVLLVEAFDHKIVHALGYAKTIRAEQILAVHIEVDPMTTLELETAWESAGLTHIPLKVLRGHGDAGDRLAGFVGGLPTGRDVNILVPLSHEVSRWSASRNRARARGWPGHCSLRAGATDLVRDHPEGVHPLTKDADGYAKVRLTHGNPHGRRPCGQARSRDPSRDPRTDARRERRLRDPRGDRPCEGGRARGRLDVPHLPIPLTLLEC